jgi:hypothetical protein
LVAAIVVALLLPVTLLVGNWTEHDLRGEQDAADYAAAALAVTEPGALVVTSGDQSTFALWYRRHGLGERPDVTVVNVGLWGHPWYRETLAARDPEIARINGVLAPGDLAGLVALSLWRRPVYVTEEAREAVGQGRLQAALPLYRLEP